MDDKTIKFLDKVLKDLVLDTKLDKLGLHLPFYKYGTIYILQKKEISKVLKNREYKYRDYFYGYVMDTYSLTIEEAFAIYPKYIELLEDKFDGVKNLNESIDVINLKLDDKQKKYLDKVVNYLIDLTKINNDGTITSSPFELPEDYKNPPHSHLSSPTPSLYSFMDQMKDIYGLSYDEMMYVWQGYRDFILVNVFGEKSPIKSFSFDTINEEIHHTDNYDITNKGKLNFIDKITDMMMEETYIEDIDWGDSGIINPDIPEGLRRIYFYKGEHYQDDEYAGLDPSKNWVEFIKPLQRDTKNATENYLKKWAGITDLHMTIYVWNEYLYKLREKYFNGKYDKNKGPLHFS